MKTLITTLIVLGFMTSGQWQFKADNSQSTITVFGTSSVHDWESQVKTFTVSGQMAEKAVTNLKVEVTTKSITSGKSIMDDKTYEALKADKFAKITFTAAELAINGKQITGTGKLQLVGVTKDLPLKGEVISQTDSQAKVKGSVEVNMKDFGIDPPTAMFGTLETGEKVTIQYELILNK